MNEHETGMRFIFNGLFCRVRH